MPDGLRIFGFMEGARGAGGMKMVTATVIQTLAFSPSNVAQTYKEIMERAENLSEALDWIDDHGEAATVSAERRILCKIMAAMREEYGQNYFD